MHLSSSAIMSGYIPKTQTNNFLNYTPPKPNSRVSTEVSPDFLARQSLQFAPGGQRYSPELESLRRDFNDQIRNMFYSLTAEINTLKRDSTDNRSQMDDLRKELDTANARILQGKDFNNPIKDIKSSRFDDPGFLNLNGWNDHTKRPDEFSSDILNIHEKIVQLSRQLQTVGTDVENIKKAGYLPKEQFTKGMGECVDELEKKLNIINERVKERMEEMDTNLVESLKGKEKDFNKLYYDIRSIQSSMIRVSDQVNTFTHSAEMNLESQIKSVIHGYHADLKNLATITNTAEQKLKLLKKEETSMMMNSSMQQYQNKETGSKFKELDTIYQSIILLEKEMRAKVDMVDLNVNSIKRTLELELSLQLKNMMLPLQNNVEQYLQNSDGRFVALEDAVLNHMKREAEEKANRMRETTDFRNSHVTVEDRRSVNNKHDFENISNIESYKESKSEKKKGYLEPRIESAYGAKNQQKEKQKEKEREREKYIPEVLRVDEVESVVIVNHTLNSPVKGESHENRSEDKSMQEPSYRTETKQETLQDDVEEDEFDEVELEDQEENVEEEEEELEEEEDEEEPLGDNIAKKMAVDKDKNKKQRDSEYSFKSFEPPSQPEMKYRDFPAVSAMKSHLELERPQTRVQDKASAKKKKPEIDISEVNEKPSLRETPKKSSAKTSPLNLDSRLGLGSGVFSNEEEEPSPIVRKKSDVKEKKTNLERGRPLVDDALMEDNEEEFHGNIKGLLKKARNKRENTPTLEDEDYRPAGNKGRGIQDSKAGYTREQPVEDRFRRNLPLPNTRGNSRENDKKKDLKPALPPVDTKSIKNFNKGGKTQGKGLLQNNRQNLANNNRGGNWGMRGMEEEEDVEEIVYHVDEEGFLVDEQGNYLVDEQGNFLQLSPDQMKEIEDNDLVYEKPY